MQYRSHASESRVVGKIYISKTYLNKENRGESSSTTRLPNRRIGIYPIGLGYVAREKFIEFSKEIIFAVYILTKYSRNTTLSPRVQLIAYSRHSLIIDLQERQIQQQDS